MDILWFQGSTWSTTCDDHGDHEIWLEEKGKMPVCASKEVNDYLTWEEYCWSRKKESLSLVYILMCINCYCGYKRTRIAGG